MKDAKISEIKNQLSRYLALVRRGEVVRILDRNVGAEALAGMERKGLIRRGTGKIAREILESDPPGKPCGVMQALLAERSVR
jgi:antitoxin (DNA-binding transcriptional repressor) of toxin-antitoxin stability system